MKLTATLNATQVNLTANFDGISVALKPVTIIDAGGGGDMLASTYDPANKATQILATSDLIDDDTMATATASTVSSSESIKAYVDANAGGGNIYSHFFSIDSPNTSNWSANNFNSINGLVIFTKG